MINNEKDLINSKEKFKKFLKNFKENFLSKRILISLFFLGIIFLYLLCASIFVSKDWIISGGSTSVDPIMEELTPWYKNNYNVDFVYNSMGSAAAPVGIKNGYFDMGFESKSITPIEDSNYYSPFIIAKDYFIILFHLPDDVKINYSKFSESGDDWNSHAHQIELPGINTDNSLGNLMNDLYNPSNGKDNWTNFANEINKIDIGNNNISFTGTNANKSIVTFTRESGSGTRDYMEQNILQNSTTVNASVQSSNGGMFNAINTTPSSMGYISFSYMTNIINSIESGSNLAYAIVKNDSSSTYETPFDSKSSNLSFNTNYSLTRSFEGIISKKAKNLKECLWFVNRILWTPEGESTADPDSNPIQSIINKLGFQPISYKDSADNINKNIQSVIESKGISTTENPFNN